MKGVTLPTETVFVMEASPIKFGLGATDEIAYDVRRLGLKRVLIVTDHSDYDYPKIVREAQLVVDSRNATKGIQSDKIVRC